MTAASKYTSKTSTAKINGYDTSYVCASIGNRNATGLRGESFAAHSHQDYTWGLDVNNTMEGAGCVGGLAMVTAPLSVALNHVDQYGNGLPPDPYNNPDPTATAYDTWFPTYDQMLKSAENELISTPGKIEAYLCGGTYGLCYIAYEKVFQHQKEECEKWNKDHGF